MFGRIWLVRIVAVTSAAALLAGCGALSGDEEEARPIVVGTTSAPSVLDPAGAWDGSWELYRNIYQSLLGFPNSSGTPEPDAAESCGFTDDSSQVYRCTLKPGLTFAGGNPLDAEAVKFSLERTLRIDAPTGPAQLLDGLARIETSGGDTVVLHLEEPNATFPLVLATPAAALVDPEVYPADELLTGDAISGSGPYELASYTAGGTAELTANAAYRGLAEPRNDAVTIRYFQDSGRLVESLETGEVDLTFRGLTPEQIIGFRDAGPGESEIELSEVTGTEIRYLVFNPDDASVADPAVRAAIAQLIDRKALVREVYERTAEPLYSMVPGGITGHTSAFHDRYGEPSRDKAEQILLDAGITEPVELVLWYTTDRYGATTEDEFAEIRRQLNASGLFDATVQGRPWNEFQQAYQEGEYAVFGRGWFPDFPDADNYIGPFVGNDNALGIPYEEPELTERLLPKSRQQSDRATAGETLREAQRVLAEDARLLPLWQGRVHIAAHESIAGVEWALDASTIMRMWELHRKSGW